MVKVLDNSSQQSIFEYTHSILLDLKFVQLQSLKHVEYFVLINITHGLAEFNQIND